jgi:hypothetical protein
MGIAVVAELLARGHEVVTFTAERAARSISARYGK